MKILSIAEKRRKRIAKGFDISHFYWPFSSNVMAVKGLKQGGFRARSSPTW